MRVRLTLALLLCLTLSGCFFKPYRMEIRQGNYLDQTLIEQLKPGMTRSQVRFLLGTPMLADPFHPDRWDYVYINWRQGKLKEFHRLTVFFEGDQLARAVTDLPGAAPSAAPAQGNAELAR